jgi:hypothetical protein
VSDSVQPVHSWNDSQITDGRLALSSAFAIAGTMVGGSAIIDAVAAQNFRKLRRETPCLRSISPSVLSFFMVGSARALESFFSIVLLYQAS